MQTALVLFTRDLRLRDNPALWAAALEARLDVPLFAPRRDFRRDF